MTYEQAAEIADAYAAKLTTPVVFGIRVDAKGKKSFDESHKWARWGDWTDETYEGACAVKIGDIDDFERNFLNAVAVAKSWYMDDMESGDERDRCIYLVAGEQVDDARIEDYGTADEVILADCEAVAVIN